MNVELTQITLTAEQQAAARAGAYLLSEAVDQAATAGLPLSIENVDIIPLVEGLIVGVIGRNLGFDLPSFQAAVMNEMGITSETEPLEASMRLRSYSAIHDCPPGVILE